MRVLCAVKKRTHRRGRTAVLGAACLCLIGVMVPVGAGSAAADDDRDKAAQAVDEASADVNELRSQLEGIDADLANVFVELQDLNMKIPVAEAECADAQSAYETANREHEVALAQLEAAEAERDRLANRVESAQDDQTEATAAIADLARQMYKDGSSSAITVALTADGTQSIDQRTAAADAMSRSQAQALNAALDAQATQRTQVARQEAITERIGELEATAKTAAVKAAAAKDEAEAKVDALNTLKKDAEAKQAQWDSMKDRAEAELKQAEADYEAKRKELEKIDAANRAANTTYTTSSSGWVNPVNNMTITSPFGWRFHPVLGYEKFHSGTDFGAACGDKIYAVADGTVSDVSSSESAGNYVDVNHGMVGGASTITEYLHMQAIYVSPGQQVKAGQVLGEVGMTGYATGCHLHFGVLQNGSNVDPMNYF